MAPTKLIALFLQALAATSVLGHPGELQDPHHIKREVAKAHLLAGAAKRSLDTCGSSRSAQALQSRNVKRRAAVAESLRKKRDISARQYHTTAILEETLTPSRLKRMSPRFSHTRSLRGRQSQLHQQ